MKSHMTETMELGCFLGEWDYIGIYCLLYYIYIYIYSIYTVSICLYGDNMGIYGLGLSETDQWSTVSTVASRRPWLSHWRLSPHQRHL